MAKTWIIFVVMTVASWGLYGVFLHQGQASMGASDKGDLSPEERAHNRYKAFLFVGLAYLLTAVIGSALILLLSGDSGLLTFR